MDSYAATGLFLGCLMYGLRYTRQNRLADLAFYAISLGLLAGVKFYALGYAGLAGLGIVLLVAYRAGVRQSVLTASALLLGAALFGGYWYMRNAWVTGSPLYPKGFTPESDLMMRLYPAIGTSSFLGNGSPELAGLLVKAVWQMNGPVHVAALLAMPVSFFWLLATGWQRSRRHTCRGDGSRRVLLAALLAGTVVLLLVTPFAVEDEPGTLNQMLWHYCPVRYGLCFLSLAILCLSLVLQDVGRSIRKILTPGDCERAGPIRTQTFIRGARPGARAVAAVSLVPHVLMGIGAGVQFASPDQRLEIDWLASALIGINVVFGFTLLLLVRVLWPRGFGAAVPFLWVATLGAGAVGIERLAERWHKDHAAYYDHMLAPRVFSHLARNEEDGTRVCVLDRRCYPFFGSRRQFRVCQPMRISSSDWLLSYLRDQRAEIVIGRSREPISGWDCFRGFAECMARHPGAFRILNRGGERLAMYRVRLGASQ
ncbi:MAG: hypothetical protein K2X00_12405 [Nitrospiraceae bacterium]|nr:hypothetical protein [Nitrospiraceae bacterium]